MMINEIALDQMTQGGKVSSEQLHHTPVAPLRSRETNELAHAAHVHTQAMVAEGVALP